VGGLAEWDAVQRVSAGPWGECADDSVGEDADGVVECGSALDALSQGSRARASGTGLLVRAASAGVGSPVGRAVCSMAGFVVGIQVEEPG
jgi:hypothetical protein